MTSADLLPAGAPGRAGRQGLLWIQDGGTYGTSDNRNLSVFLRGMLLDDDARDLLPSWAGFVGGVIESNRLTPTASREDLQRDDHYAAIQHALAEALIAGLGEGAAAAGGLAAGPAAAAGPCWERRCATSVCSR